jgi:hypothetical protein
MGLSGNERCMQRCKDYKGRPYGPSTYRDITPSTLDDALDGREMCSSALINWGMRATS